MDQISTRIKKLRNAGGISQEVLANANGISDKSLRRYENNILLPSVDTMKSIACYFGVSEEYLFGLMSYYDEIDFENKLEKDNLFCHYVNNRHNHVYKNEDYYWLLIDRKHIFNNDNSNIIMTYQKVKSIYEIDHNTMIINNELDLECKN